MTKKDEEEDLAVLLLGAILGGSAAGPNGAILGGLALLLAKKIKEHR